MSVTKKGSPSHLKCALDGVLQTKWIHLASDASKTFILTVCDDPKDAPKKKARGHRKLFRELSKLLISGGIPAP